MIKKALCPVFLLLCCIYLPCAQAEEKITLSTYYPAPYGEYDQLAANSMVVGRTYPFPANDNLIVEGSVGIGTTAPATILDIGGGINYTNLTASYQFYAPTAKILQIKDTNQSVLNLVSDINTNLGTVGAVAFTRSAGQSDAHRNIAGIIGVQQNTGTLAGGMLQFWTKNYGGAGSTKMVISNDGSVGIGTTSPGRKLELSGTSPGLKITDTAATGNAFVELSTVDGGLSYFQNTGGRTRIYVGGERMTFLTNGNVGIGTAAPSAKLDVRGTTYADGHLYVGDGTFSNPGNWDQTINLESSVHARILIEENSTGVQTVLWSHTGGNAKVGTISNHNFGIMSNGSERMTINTSGYVGINTTAPGCVLDVYAKSTTWGGWAEAVRFSNPSCSAITYPTGGLLFGLHSNRNYYWADTTNGWYAMTLNANGNLSVRGTLSKGSGSFLIDHPLDPENKVLRHSFVESPEPVLIYKGRARLAGFKAKIDLPEYFDALNHPEGREISLTCIGGWSPLYLEDEISGNSLTVKTTPEGNPEQEFSWVVYTVRNDAFIQKNPVITEEEKGIGNTFTKGEYLYPELFPRQ